MSRKVPTTSAELRALRRDVDVLAARVAELANTTAQPSAHPSALPPELTRERVLTGTVCRELFGGISKPTWLGWCKRHDVKPAFYFGNRAYYAEPDVQRLRALMAASPIRIGRPPRRREENVGAES